MEGITENKRYFAWHLGQKKKDQAVSGKLLET